MTTYADFIGRKTMATTDSGIKDPSLPGGLFHHQELLARWALRKGRAAVFADTGLGKTRIEIAWAHCVAAETNLPVLILAPLAVAEQTVREGAAMSIPVRHVRDQADVLPSHPISITNYDRLHRFDCAHFGAVVLDESSIIKHYNSKTLAILMESFVHCDYRLACTATPSPNDWTELGTHAEWLGVRTRTEMLSEFFWHDASVGETVKAQGWRLKRHAVEAYWQWVATWAALIQLPSDIGGDDTGYILPPIHRHEHAVKVESVPEEGYLFPLEAGSLMERKQARRESAVDRCEDCAAVVNAHPDEPWIVWCDLNTEADMLHKLIPGSVEIRGADEAETKERALLDFATGAVRVLITKPSIAGFGLNWQHCARVAFVGVSDSFEAYHQAVRRCWRFGQKRDVHVHLFVSEREGSVMANLERKQALAAEMADQLRRYTGDAVRASVVGQSLRYDSYHAEDDAVMPPFLRAQA